MIRITQLVKSEISKVIVGYEDYYESVPVIVAKVEMNNGNRVIPLYAYYYPFASIESYPKFFVTKDNELDFMANERREGVVHEFILDKILFSQDYLNWIKSARWANVFRFLSRFDLNSPQDKYYADMLFDTVIPGYLFPWHQVKEYNWPVEVNTDSGKATLLKLNSYPTEDDPFEAADMDGVYFDGELITSIDGLFDHSGIREIVLSPSVKRIGRYSFAGCRNLEQLYIPKDSKIDFSAFRGNGDFGYATRIVLI